MRSTFAGLNTMVRGIFSNQLSLDTVGHNITNASTEGYSRQSVNLAATRAEQRESLYGNVLVGSGVDAMSVQRARNVYADKQFWAESSMRNYYATQKTNYDKIEAIFDDSDKTGVLKAMQAFYDSWVNLSVYASDSASRTSVISKAINLIDRIKTAGQQLQDQIKAQYDDMRINLQAVNTITKQIAELNQNIMQSEVNGGYANDLRDQRDLLVDQLSKYTNVNVYEENNGMYTVVSNGITLVNRNGTLTLEMSDPINNESYGVTDYGIRIKEADVLYLPQNGILKGLQDTIAEDKSYIDHLANVAATFLTTFNTLHKSGSGIDAAATTNINFFGDKDTTYTWNDTNKEVQRTGGLATTPIKAMQLIKELQVSSAITETGGQSKIAARRVGNGTADGSLAVELSKLFNMDQANTDALVNNPATHVRAIGTVSINQYYRTVMSKLGADSEDLVNKIKAQDDLITQVIEWRQSTAGVDWNEELSNMIKFQKGYQACSRCLTAMDEILDRLINSTGVVGR